MRILVVLAAALVCFGSLNAQTTLTIAFDEASPPYSIKTDSGQVTGLFADLADLLATQLAGVKLVKVAVPWARAQSMVEHGEADAFLTYPSVARRAYAQFAELPLFVEDIGYLVFRRAGPTNGVLRRAKSLRDLEGLRINVTIGSEWEQDNIPASITRVTSNSDSGKLSLLARRGDGDFTIMGREQLAWWSRSLNLTNELEWRKVDFLPDSQVPFHLGIRKSSPVAERLIATTNRVMASKGFQKSLAELLARYQP